MTTPYQVDGDQLRCTRHGVTFEAAHGSCEGCDADPGEALDLADEPLAAAPDGCESTLDIERGYGAEAARVLAAVHELAKVETSPPLVATGKGKGKARKRVKPSRMFLATAFRGWESWLKVKRAQFEAAREREHEEIQRQRERRDAEREAGRAH